MKILQINKFLYPKGGSETYMFELSDALKEYGHEVEFWGMYDEKNIVKDRYNCFTKNIDFSNLSSIKKITKSIETIYSIENRKKISTILDAFKPDIVHIHNYNFQLTPSILPEIKKRGIKIVHTVHDSQLVCPYHRLYNFQKDEICTKCVEGSFFNSIKDRCFDGSLMKSAVGAMESYLYHSLNYYKKYIDVIVSPSHFLASIIEKRFNGVIEVIPNFINRKSLKKTKKEYVLYFGRISKEKGIVEIVKIFEEKKIPLIIIGNGPESSKLHNSEYIQYIGAKYGNELFSYIAEAKFVIQPSKWYENCPMTVIESFSCATPVIASYHSGFLDLIDNQQTGFLVDFNSKNISDRIDDICKSDTSLMEDNCLIKYKEKFTKEAHLPKIINLYERIIDESI